MRQRETDTDVGASRSEKSAKKSNTHASRHGGVKKTTLSKAVVCLTPTGRDTGESSGNPGTVAETAATVSDNIGAAAERCLSPVQAADEIVDKEQAWDTLQEMRVTLAQDNNASANKNPPSTARQVLCSLQVNKQMMTHCITGETDNSKVIQTCVTDQKANYYCFVSKMDPKGSTPQEILDVIYCLDMMQRYYTNQRPMPNARGGGDEIFDVPKLGPNNGRTVRQNGAVFHKIVHDDGVVTVPILKMKLFIEQANTGGELPLVMFFMFLVVEVPMTFDLVDSIYRSCTKNAIGREKHVCDDMKRIWTNIAHRHQSFSGSGKKTLESMLQIQFNDIFDPDSPNCFWKMFRMSRCIQQARLHMHMWAMDNITSRSKISVHLANLLINIRFNSIDKVLDGNCPSLASDGVFVAVSDLCCAAFSEEFDYCKQRVKLYKSTKRSKTKPADDADGGAAEEQEEDAENEMPVFDPPIMLTQPTFVDWECEETRNMFLQLTLPDMQGRPAEMHRMLQEHMLSHPGTVKMQGFPITNMVAYVDPTMLLPHSGALVAQQDWLIENKECALPDQMTMCILVMMHQKQISSRSIFSNFMQTQDCMPRNILTLSDLRMSFLSEDDAGRKMMYRRATPVRDKQMESVKANANFTQRGYALQYYLLGTVYPLAYANARSDTGNYGGRDHAASVHNEIGEYQNMGGLYLSSIAEGFHAAYDKLMLRDKTSKWHLKEYPGTLYNTLHMWKASMDNMNENYRLKPNNVQLLFRLMQSDIGVRLTFLVNSIGPAPNGIGMTNVVKNFGGNIMRRARRTTAMFETKNAKAWGTGADCTTAKFIEAIDPANNGCPSSIPHSNCGKPDDFRKTTEAGTWYLLTQTYDQNGKPVPKQAEMPPPMYCNEMPVSDSRSGGNSAVNMAGKLCSILPRNTEVDQAGKRTLTVKNEKTGNHEAAEQRIVWFMGLLLKCQNTESDNALEHTLDIICQCVASGSVDVDDGDTSGDAHKTCGFNDMGDSCKYTVKKNDPVVDMCKRLFAFDARAVCIAVSGMQWRGWLPDSPALAETIVFDILANYVYLHTCIQTQDARLTAQRGRETQKAQARLPPTALYMHSANALLQRSIKTMSWSEITCHAALNFMADPSPLELVPLFLGSMIENTFDWGFWLILGMFADFFETPYLDVEEAERLFADPKYIIPDAAAKTTRNWLATFGIGGIALNKVRGDTLFKVEQGDSVQQSTVYITSKWDEDMNVSASKLAVNIPSFNGGGGGGGGQGGGGGGGGARDNYASSSSAALTGSAMWKIAEQIGAVMYAKYDKKLNSACNINSPEDLCIMLYRYMDAPVCYPKFGRVPCGHGFQSWDCILNGLGCDLLHIAQGQHEDSDKFVDGLHPSMRQLISHDNYSYNIAPWTFNNRGGSVFSFGVEPRFLILARAIIGTKPLVSQTSVQSIFDHFVLQTVKHRVPATVYPYCTLFTGIPDSNGLGLSLQKIDEEEMYRNRPTTMLRALPCVSVKEMTASSIPGILVGGVMVEDVAILNKFERICKMVDISHDALHLDDLAPPQLPFYCWIYVEMVYKTDSLDQSKFDAAKAKYKKVCMFIDPKKNKITRCLSTSSFTRARDCEQVEALDPEENKVRSHSKVFRTITDAVMPVKNGFIRYAPIYNRLGTLIHVAGVGYLVLTQWTTAQTNMPDVQYPAWLETVYLNPENMSYLAVSEGIDLHETPSYIAKLQTHKLEVYTHYMLACTHVQSCVLY